MKKVETQIPSQNWGNLVTKYPPYSKRVQISDFTAGTKNIDTDIKGVITKRKGSVLYNSTPLTEPIKDQYEAIFSDGARHLLIASDGKLYYSSGDTVLNLVQSGYSAVSNFEFATTQDRVYFGNGVDAPQVYDRTTNYGLVPYIAPKVRNMGATPPSTAPTSNAPTAGGNVPDGAHVYKVTFVYAEGQESNGSPASASQTAGAGNNTIPLTAIPIGGYGVTARKIYRASDSPTFLNYVLITTIDNNTAITYNDTSLAGFTPIPIDHFPPPNFSRITNWLDSLWVSKVDGDPYTLFHSVPGLPDIWPDNNFIICNQEDPIEGTVVYLDRLIVFNRKSMGQILGTTKDTFRYADIQGSVGCVDVRSIQIRVISGVPLLVWLSDRGFYSYDGNAVNYLSDPIEDQVNFNIQQASSKKGQITQTTTGDFQAGLVKSDAIDLTAIEGSITTPNPTTIYQVEPDWEKAGTSNTNTAIYDGANAVKVPTRFAPTLASGILSGSAIIDGGSLKVTVVADSTGETFAWTNQRIAGHSSAGSGIHAAAYAVPWTAPRNGVLVSFNTTVFGWNFAFGSNDVYVRPVLWANSAGVPGTPLWIGSMPNYLKGVGYKRYADPNWNVTKGVTYWIGVEARQSGTETVMMPHFPSLIGRMKTGAGWVKPDTSHASAGLNLTPSTDTVSFKQAAMGASGSWESKPYDTFSKSVSVGLNITHTGSYPSGSYSSGPYTTSGSTVLEGSDSSSFSGGPQVTQTVNNVNGTQSYTLSGKRYWRIRQNLNTTDDRATPVLGTPTLTFNNEATWISEPIDCKSDITELQALVQNEVKPSGTSIVYTVSTSADNITYPDGFVSFATAVPRKWVRIKAVLTATSNNATTPILNSVRMDWKTVADFQSSIINTGTTQAAGWDIFRSTRFLNGGQLTYRMRADNNQVTLLTLPFVTVTPGQFPVVPKGQYVQYQALLTSEANKVPVVDDVTVGWLLEEVDSIRVASLFHNGRYYLSAAELEQATNNIVFVLDLENKWRVYKDINVATFSRFFDLPYWGSATEGNVYQFLEGPTDAGALIPVEIFTKSFDFSTQHSDNSEFLKIPLELMLQGKNTGASYKLYYSVDEAQTFHPMILNNGSSELITSLNERNFHVIFRASQGDNLKTGNSVMFKIVSEDENDIELQLMKVQALVLPQRPIITG